MQRIMLVFYFLFLRIRRPPRSTRTDTLFPYTTLFRSGLVAVDAEGQEGFRDRHGPASRGGKGVPMMPVNAAAFHRGRSGRAVAVRSEEHTSELQSLMRISYAVFCLKKKKHHTSHPSNPTTLYYYTTTQYHFHLIS